MIPNWLPAQEAPIALDTSDSTTRFRIGDFGTAVIEPLRNSAGEITKVIAMPTEWGPETIMARGDGSRWSDPELKQWESRGHAESADIDWSG